MLKSIQLLTLVFSPMQANTTEHLFSKHDNRHAFQNHGVYFGQVCLMLECWLATASAPTDFSLHCIPLDFYMQGLGKRQVVDERNQHRSQDIIAASKDMPQQVSLHSTYQYSFNASQKKAAAVQQSQIKLPQAVGRVVGSAQRQTASDSGTMMQKGVLLHRRYPRSHVPPKHCPSLTNSASWYVHHSSTDAYHTPLSVLACTQLPFLPSNPWRYFNRRKSYSSKRTMLNATV